MKAWMAPIAMSKSFQTMSKTIESTPPTGTAPSVQAVSAPISASMMPPAKMLPKSRSASEIGLVISSMMFSGSRNG